MASSKKVKEPKAPSKKDPVPSINAIVEQSRLISHDIDDVKNALKRETQDGKGEKEPPPSNWTGFATEGVEREE